jgi:GT2 family glycosyltransferase
MSCERECPKRRARARRLSAGKVMSSGLRLSSNLFFRERKVPRNFMTGETSVVIPCYNSEEYLPEALESVRDQTRPVREVIVVDDGSETPVSPPAQWQGPPLRIVRTENRGLPAARNLGASLATSRFIALLDADDAWAPEKIEMQEAALNARPDNIAVFTQRSEKPGWPACEPVPYPPVDATDNDLWASLWRRNFIAPSSLMVRLDAMLQAGGFDESLRSCEDWEFWFRLLKAGRFVQVPRVLCYRRMHPEQMTKNAGEMALHRRRVRLLIMRDHGERLAAAGISVSQQREQAREEYRQDILMTYFQRRLPTARRLFWDYLSHYPGDAEVFRYALFSLLPGPLLQMLRGRT